MLVRQVSTTWHGESGGTAGVIEDFRKRRKRKRKRKKKQKNVCRCQCWLQSPKWIMRRCMRWPGKGPSNPTETNRKDKTSKGQGPGAQRKNGLDARTQRRMNGGDPRTRKPTTEEHPTISTRRLYFKKKATTEE